MKTRIPALLLALLLTLGTCVPTVRADAAPEDADEPLVEALKGFFAGAEGDYDAVNADDGGACSIGLLQWHGARALALLRFALEGWPGCANYLSAALYREITDPNTVWSRRRLADAEARLVSNLLSSQDGRAAQDAMARQDILAYVSLCRSWGMQTDATAAYFAVIVNQFGSGGAASYLRHIRETLGVDETAVFRDLTVLHQAVHDTKSYGQRYLSMRDKSYDYIVSLGWDLTGSLSVRKTAPPGDGPLARLFARYFDAWSLPGDPLELLPRLRALTEAP